MHNVRRAGLLVPCVAGPRRNLADPSHRCHIQRGAAQSQRWHCQTVCRAKGQEEKEKDIVGGIDINQEGDIWEGELVGIVVKVTLLHWVNCGEQQKHDTPAVT